MPKSFAYRAVTANCGNDSIGKSACNQIAQLLTEGQGLDFVVINCQEVDFQKTRRQLKQLAKEKGYSVQCVAKMTTHTKPLTQLHSGTGIATFVIHKSDLTLHTESSKIARRSYKRLSGTPYNKGGLVTDFTLTRNKNKPDEEQIKIQAISGHLDSKYTARRNEDWANLHRASSKKKVESWIELVAACSHLKISGYDANTRNKLELGTGLNLMKERPDEPEIQALYRAPFADRCFSSDVTYSKSPNEDPKRPGYLAEGMLDYVGISDGSEPKLHISTEPSIKVDTESSTERDHAVIISPLQEYTASKSDFEVVKSQMASRLHYVAPELARQIRNLDENDAQSTTRLINIYNDYLSINGVLNKAIRLQSRKLDVFNKLMEEGFLQDDEIKKQLADTLFKNTNWCEGSVETLVAKRRLTMVLILSLSFCKHETGIKERLNWYHELEAQIDAGSKINPRQEFKDRIIAEYIETRSKFVQDLNNYDYQDDSLRQQFHESATKVLRHLDAIFSPDLNASGKRNINARSFEMLTRIAENCQKACTAVHSQKDNVPRIVQELKELSQEAGSKSSILWRGLNSVLNVFIKLAVKIAGVSPEKLNLLYSKEEHLAHSVAQYKSVLKKLQVQSRAGDDLKKGAEKNGDLNDNEDHLPTRI